MSNFLAGGKREMELPHVYSISKRSLLAFQQTVHLSAAEQAEAAKEGAHVNQSVLISGESVRRMLWSSIDPFDSPIDAHARALLCLGPIGGSHVRSPCPR